MITVLSIIWLIKSILELKQAFDNQDTPEGLPRNVSWPGLGRQPKWSGNIPPVTDYVRPRYVYEDGTESETPMQSHGRVIGYRVGPALVIHNQIGYGEKWAEYHIGKFMDCFDGKLLTASEVSVLRANWETVSAMRKKIGDAPLPKAVFWSVDIHGYAVATAWDDDETFYALRRCAIILKR